MIDEYERDLLERGLRAALERHTDVAIDEALYELGWYEAMRDDPRTAISVLFELYGELNASSSLDSVMASVLRRGDRVAAVMLPMFGSLDPPGERHGDTLIIHGIIGRTIQGAEHAIVASRSGSRTEIHTVMTDELDRHRITGIDPGLGWFEVAGTIDAGSHAHDDEGEVWQDAVAIGRLALSHELIGTSRGMLRLARNHAIGRIQFGAPISSFQAVRHRLADSLVAIAAAEASVAAAWESSSPFNASVAKAVAGRSARQVARHSQQVLAGMGFTAEHPLHRFVKRALVLDQTLGASGPLTRWIGEELLRSKEVPVALPL